MGWRRYHPLSNTLIEQELMLYSKVGDLHQDRTPQTLNLGLSTMHSLRSGWLQERLIRPTSSYNCASRVDAMLNFCEDEIN